MDAAHGRRCGSISRRSAPAGSRTAARSMVVHPCAAADVAAAASASSAKSPSSEDLLIVGPGVLGSLLGKLWLDDHPGATVVGQTNTTNSHDK